MPDADRPDAVAAAARRLAAGGLVAFATETVYGLGARADDDRAVAAIFEAKGRPSDHPLIVHVADQDAAEIFADRLPEAARRLMAAFWPGPVTVIVPRRAGMAGAASGGQPTVGLRCPAHPQARALLAQAAALGVPGVAAPSANRFGRISPTTAAHVREEFGQGLCVLDGGACAEGIESAIVDTTRAQPVLLRPGTVGRAALEQALGQALAPPGRQPGAPSAPAAAAIGPSGCAAGAIGPSAAAAALATAGEAPAPQPSHVPDPRAPGTLAAHYAPRARLRLMDAEALAAAWAAQAEGEGHGGRRPRSIALYCRRAPAGATAPAWEAMADGAAEVAREMFAALRRLDATGAAEIWVERPPELPAWEGVRDRLQRAAAAG